MSNNGFADHLLAELSSILLSGFEIVRHISTIHNEDLTTSFDIHRSGLSIRLEYKQDEDFVELYLNTGSYIVLNIADPNFLTELKSLVTLGMKKFANFLALSESQEQARRWFVD